MPSASSARVIAGVAVAPRIVEQFVVGPNVEALAGSLRGRTGAAKIRRASRNPPMTRVGRVPPGDSVGLIAEASPGRFDLAST
jgi:hypothetical protein